MSQRSSGRRPQVMLVEDNPGDVDFIVSSLRDSNLASGITVAQDGERALEMLRGEGEYAAMPLPDIMLLDLNLPRMSGLEVLSKVKQDPQLRRIPVVIMTSSHAEEDIARSYDLHANCFVTKPVDLNQYRELMRSIEEFWLTIAKLTKPPATTTSPLPAPFVGA